MPGRARLNQRSAFWLPYADEVWLHGGHHQIRILMKKIVLGSFLGAVAMLMWGAVFWMGPLPKGVALTARDESALGQALRQHLHASGTYTLPGLATEPKRAEELAQKGPFAVIHYRSIGGPLPDPSLLLRGFLIEWVTVALIACLMQMAFPVLNSYMRRVLFVMLAAITLAIHTDAGAVVWWHHDASWAWLMALYDVSAWTLAGLVLAAFVKPSQTSR